MSLKNVPSKLATARRDQMFLYDTTLVLIDPTRGRAAMDEARDWSKRLEKHLGKDRAVKLLVRAKVDRISEIIDLNQLSNLTEECGFAAFLDLSAKTGRNTRRLRRLISGALDWDQMAKTSRPELFQRIRDDIEARRKLVNCWEKGGVHIVGAGTFGSPEEGRPESTPRLYNLLEIQADLKSVRVHTREQRKAEGAWQGWHEWPDPNGGDGHVPYFDIELQD